MGQLLPWGGCFYQVNHCCCSNKAACVSEDPGHRCSVCSRLDGARALDPGHPQRLIFLGSWEAADELQLTWWQADISWEGWMLLCGCCVVGWV